MAEPAPQASAYIQALRSRLASGSPNAEADFWSEVAVAGVPLVDPVEGDDRLVLVTFLWRGAKDTDNVLLASPWSGDTPADNLMERVPDTDVFFRTYRAKSTARGS